MSKNMCHAFHLFNLILSYIIEFIYIKKVDSLRWALSYINMPFSYINTLFVFFKSKSPREEPDAHFMLKSFTTLWLAGAGVTWC